MKRTIAILFLLTALSSALSAQSYLRGEVKDEKNNALLNARILLHSTGYVYYSGSGGTFGINIPRTIDSITISMDGYQPLSVQVDAGRYQSLVLKSLYAGVKQQKNRLLSVTKNLRPEERANWTVGAETYSSLLENEFIGAAKYPETGFAINTDKASYSNVRRFLNMNTTVPPDAVRTEEMLNYFNFEYVPPPPDSVFGFKSYVSECPWNKQHQLLSLHVSARKIDPDSIPASNLVFLIDVSGSMDMPNRLPLLKSAFKLLVDNLRDKDTISIVVYGSTVAVWLVPTSGKDKQKIRKSIEELYPGGATPGESGIRMAYNLAKSQYIKNGNNRVILATDGDFNIGQTSEEELEKMITLHQQWGIYLTCLGVGMGNYKDSKLEVLSKKGNGNFAYLDNETEAEKVLVKELTQTLFSVADDAYLNIAFNADAVQDYRLIGFDNKWKVLADSVSELEGGEVGSGHSIMALFEIVPALNSDNALHVKEEIAKVTINYRVPNDSLQRVTSYNCPFAITQFKDLPSCYQFASGVAMFAAMLKDSKFAKTITWTDVLRLASNTCNTNDVIQKEFIGMVEKAKKIYGKMKKRRRD